MKDWKRQIRSLGADLAGFADLSAIPPENRGGLPYGVAMGIAVDPGIVGKIPSGTVICQYCDEYDRINQRLDKLCLAVAEEIRYSGYRAVAQTTAYVREHGAAAASMPSRSLLPHKTVAALSGMGWITKSALLVTPQYGSALRLTSVLTDLPLEAVAAEYTCRCGPCTICADACPGKAIKGIAWDIQLDRDDLIDYDACQSTLNSRGEPYGRSGGACGICMAVCPHTRRHLSRHRI